MDFVEAYPEEEVQLEACDFCGRSFAVSRLERHKSVCSKAQDKPQPTVYRPRGSFFTGVTSPAKGQHVARHHHSAYFDQKGPFVGLFNQGATCYMNSLLQTLYMTPEFREALYAWRYTADNNPPEAHCIPYQLQYLFAQLQLATCRAVSTSALTSAFGWSANEMFQQHDVQELCRVLFDALSVAFKDAAQANLVTELYEGSMVDTLECTECHTKHQRVDSYMDIPLVVRGMKSLEESLQHFVTPDMLTGSNAYHCDTCDKKVDAEKGLSFRSFPYLLTLQLVRFTFDYNTMQRRKLNDNITFPLRLDMSPFMRDEGDKDNGSGPSGPCEYELFSILVHAGSALAGHYHAYIRNFETDEWFDFNDSHVTPVTAEQLLAMCGGVGETILPPEPEEEVDEAEASGEGDAALGGGGPGGDGNPPVGGTFPDVAAQYDGPESFTTMTGDEIFVGPKPGVAKSPEKAAAAADRRLGSNPYMLVYRRVDAERNVKAVPNDTIPSDLVEAVAAEMEAWRAARAENELLLATLTLPVYIQWPCDRAAETPTTTDAYGRRVKKHYTITIHEDKSVLEATQIVYDQLHENVELAAEFANIPLNCVRLRAYSSRMGVAGAPYEPVTESLKSFGIKKNVPLLLEVRSDDGDFEEFHEDEMPLRAYLWLPADNSESTAHNSSGYGGVGSSAGGGSFAPPVDVVVKKRAKLADLKAAIEATVGLPVAEQRLWNISDRVRADVLIGDDVGVHDELGLLPGFNVFVERREADEDESATENSGVHADFERRAHTITVRFNLVGTTSYDQLLSVDNRSTVADLKARVSEVLGLALDEFRMRKGSRSGSILDTKPEAILSEIHLYDGSGVWMEAAEAPIDEFVIKLVWLDKTVAVPKLRPLLEKFSVRGSMSLDELRHALVADSEVAALCPAPEFVRLRSVTGRKAKNVIRGSGPLKSIISGLCDGKVIALDVLNPEKQTVPEELAENDVVFHVRRWYPEIGKLGARIEFVLPDTTTVAGFKAAILDRVHAIIDEKEAQAAASASASEGTGNGTSAGKEESTNVSNGKENTTANTGSGGGGGSASGGGAAAKPVKKRFRPSKIAPADLRVVKPFDHQANDPKAIKKLNWNRDVQAPETNAISDFPWHIADGDVVLFTNVAEQPRRKKPAGRGRGGRRGRGRGGSNFDVEIFAGKHSKETGLVIHVQSGNSSAAPEGVGSESNTPAVSGDSTEIVAGGVVAESMDA